MWPPAGKTNLRWGIARDSMDRTMVRTKNGPMVAQMFIFGLFGPGLSSIGLLCLIFFEILVKHLLGVVRISTFPTRLHF